MRDIILKIFHTSDLHFGLKSMAHDIKVSGLFEDYFSYLKKTIRNILQKNLINILIISGDITSKGESEQFSNKNLLEILKWFNKYNIPICIANGNHDLNLELISKNNQFQDFMQFITDNQTVLNCKLSKNFNNNQISYVYLEESNSIFVALNSCVYIQKKSVFETFKKTKLDKITLKIKNEILNNRNLSKLDDNFVDIINEIGQKYSVNLMRELNNILDREYLKIGILKRSHLEEIFEELKSEFGNNRFNYLNKFIVCHHPLEFLRKSLLNYNFLIENNVHLLFSGHSHNFDFQDDSNNKIFNIVAGSIFANRASRSEKFDFTEKPPQFNIYDINLSRNCLVPIKYFFNQNQEWEKRTITRINDLEFKMGFTLKNWLKLNKINEKILRKLEERDFKVIFYDEQAAGPNLFFFNDTDQPISGFLIQNNDTQQKVEIIKKWFMENPSYLEKFMDNLIIIKNTEKFKNQLPIEYILN